MQRTSAVVALRELRRRLTRVRQERFPTRSEAAKALGWSARTQDVLETGEQPIRPKHIGPIVEALGIPEEEREEWSRLAEGGQARGWWDAIPDAVAGPSARHYMALEWGAQHVRSYTGVWVPALLQTPAYTTAALNAGLSSQPAERVTRVIEVRERRKQVLEEPAALRYHVIVDEAMVHRSAGPGVMADQLAHILHVVDTHPNVTVQMLPFSAGLYAGAGSPFNLLNFGLPGDAGLIHVEPALAEPIYVDDEAEYYRYSQLFDNFAAERASTAADTVERLQEAQRALGATDA